MFYVSKFDGQFELQRFLINFLSILSWIYSSVWGVWHTMVPLSSLQFWNCVTGCYIGMVLLRTKVDEREETREWSPPWCRNDGFPHTRRQKWYDQHIYWEHQLSNYLHKLSVSILVDMLKLNGETKWTPNVLNWSLWKGLRSSKHVESVG